MRRYYVHFHVDESQFIQRVDADYIATMSKESYQGRGIGYDYTFLVDDAECGTIIVAVFPTDKVDYIMSEEIPDKVDEVIQDK